MKKTSKSTSVSVTSSSNLNINGQNIKSLDDLSPEQREKVRKLLGFLKHGISGNVVEKLPEAAKKVYQENMGNVERLINQVDGEREEVQPEPKTVKPKPIVVKQSGNLVVVAVLLTAVVYFVLKVVLQLW